MKSEFSTTSSCRFGMTTHCYGILGVNVDITERKRAEEALQKAHGELGAAGRAANGQLTTANEELAIFRRFAEASGEGFGMSDSDGCITYVNPTLCRLFGEKSPEDVIGKNVSAYYPAEYVQRRQNEMIPALRRTGLWHSEQPVLSSQGKLIPTLQSTFLVRDNSGKPFRIAVVISDITERKQAEEVLRESEEKYRGLVEACPDAVVMSDFNGRVLYASRQAWALLGLCESEELAGRSIFRLCGGERSAAIGGEYDAASASGSPHKHAVHVAAE